MELHQGQVPAAEVWAVVMDAPPGSKDVSWFITAEAATRDYTEVVAYIKTKTGTAERWHVQLPAQRMEAEAVTLWVEALLLWGDHPEAGYARRLDVYSRC
jgi:hypothetical protein